MVSSGNKRILVYHHHSELLRSYAILLEHYGYEAATVDSIVQLVLRLQDGESFDLLFLECTQALRENPTKFVRFVKETQPSPPPALVLNGDGADVVLRAAREEGLEAALKPATVDAFMSVLAKMVNGRGFVGEASA